MRNKFFLVVLFSISLFSCKKDSSVVPETTNYDLANSIFRVLASADVNYNVVITDVHPNTIISDTYITQITSNLMFNYGFTPKAGDQINVKVTVPKGYSVFCEILYKDLKIGGDVITKTSDGGLLVDFNYTVPK